MLFSINREELDKFLSEAEFFQEIPKVSQSYREEANKVNDRLKALQERKEQLSENLAKTLVEKEMFKNNVDELLYYTEMANDIRKQAETLDFAIDETKNDLNELNEEYFHRYKQAVSKDRGEIGRAFNPSVPEALEVVRYQLLECLADIYKHVASQLPEEERETLNSVAFDDKVLEKGYGTLWATNVIPVVSFSNEKYVINYQNYSAAKSGYVDVPKPALIEDKKKEVQTDAK
ncbi:hypothetical protein [Priestia megaterium]|uniref:hypothetical protein n=1 Tax=Priestia megaterium TaxID=1404 RepID=UPI00244CE588|nr:hypothetical protein [Priestia megaterium]MDH2363128.1 hypothetical protein [Priestia megaterium]MDH2363137.1 hypothetical protein [Priestia megaterium]